MVTGVLTTVVFVSLISISDGEIDCPLTRYPADTSDGYITFSTQNNKRMSECRWILEATRDEWTIKIRVLQSDLDEGTNGDCRTSDRYVELLELPKKTSYGLFCGDQQPTFYSTSKRVLIKFRSFSSLHTNRGFRLQYSAGIFGSIGSEVIPTTVYTAEKKPQVLSQPYFFSKEFPLFVKRAWLIRSNDPEQEIFVRALSLSLPNDNCFFDYIQVIDGEDKTGPSLGKWCGTDTPDKAVAKGNIFIILHVRNFDIDTEFELEYGTEVTSAIPMIAGIFVGVIVFIAIVFIIGRVICSRYMNDDDSEDESERETTPAGQTLFSDVTTRDDPPPFSSLSASAPPYPELSPPVPSAPSVDVYLHPVNDHPTVAPPSYEDVVRSPLSYNDTSNQHNSNLS